MIETIVLLPTDTVFLPDAYVCDPADAGTFTVTETNQFGCDSTVIATFLLAPTDVINIEETTCDPAEVGEFIQVFTNQFGCDSAVVITTILLPENDCEVSALFAGSTIPCTAETGSIAVTVVTGQGPFTVEWTGAGTGTQITENLNETVVLPGLSAGIYTILVTDANGFTVSEEVEITQEFPPVIETFTLSDYGGFGVSCTGAADGHLTATVSGGQAPYAFDWSSGDSENETENLPAGDYTLTVTDALGCSDEAAVTLTAPDTLQMNFEISDSDCFTDNSGSIVALVTGGVLPYSYTVNDAAAQESSVFAGLAAGLYTVTAEDANGCTVTESIVVNAPFTPEVFLSGAETVTLGESTTLTAIVNIPPGTLDSVYWTNIDSTECPTCLTQTVTPIFTTTYTVTVMTENGCSDSDDWTVIADRRKQIFVPNVFTPDNDGVNDAAMIFARENTVHSIREFRIFNRWGNAVFALFGIPPNDENFGWDGTHGGSPLNSDVFVWYAVVEFADGEIEVFKGDILLAR